MMKGLIENECGGQNPLMKLTSHFAGPMSGNEQQILSQEAIRHMQQQQKLNTPEHQLVSEYLAIESEKNARAGLMNQKNVSNTNQFVRRVPAPRSFQMEALFNELKHIDNLNAAAKSTSISTSALNTTNNASGESISKNKTNSSTLNPSQTESLNGLSRSVSPSKTLSAIRSISQVNNLPQEWSQEYWASLSAAFKKQTPLIIDDRTFKWSADYLTQTEATIFDEAWENLLMKSTIGANSNNSSTTNLLSLGLNSNNENLIATNQLNEEMRKTANELLDSMSDSRFSETEFVQFVRNLSVNGLNSNTSKNEAAKETIKSELEKKLVEEFLDEKDEEGINFDLTDNDLSNEWVKEFQNLEKNSKLIDGLNNQETYWNELQEEWNSAAASNPNHPWLDDFQKVFDAYKVYEFDKENPLISHPNPFEEGIERLKLHDIVNAVLLFEVAVQKEPNNMLAWQYLGTTQVENEQDSQAIRALKRCLELKPDNLIALSTLATSYTNESMQRLAFDSLIKWIKFHPEYSNLLKNDEQATRLLNASDLLNQQAATPFYMATLSVVHARDFIDLQEIYLKAVRESASTPSKIDPDLQCCLGILFHLSSEYDKAADCFKTALQIKPNDHLLWNKLGATYANNNRNEEAIDSYYQALKLCPGFVRARYNLGIGCMNLGAYKEAVEHFLTALLQQSQATLSDVNKTSQDIQNIENNQDDDNEIKNNSFNQAKINQSNNNNIQKMSETIWSTLRLALSYLDRSDLYSYCLNKDLEYLKNEFKI